MIDQLLAILQQADLILSDDTRSAWQQMGAIIGDEDIADALWLAAQIGVETETARVETTRPKARSGSTPSVTVETVESDSPESPHPFVEAYVPESIQTAAAPIQPVEQGLPIQVQAAPALQDARSLARSLRPLMRKVRSAKQKVLDEAATVDRVADQEVWLPVMKPALERWLDLDLVIEASPFAFIWQSTLDEFQQILERQGAFRSVRTWRIEGVETGQIQLVPKKQSNLTQPPRSPKELVDVSGRRLVLYVSDCRSRVWQQGKIHEWLKFWSEYGPTTIVQLLPERLWDESELDVGVGVQVGVLTPGAPNHKLTIQNQADSLSLAAESTLTVPIVTLTAEAFKQWALMLAAVGNERAPARWFDLAWVQDPDRDLTSSIVSPESAEERVELFFATASPTAQKLACLMAAAPVNLNVIHLIQRTLLKSEPVHIAEVYASGLLTQVSSEDDNSVQYDFADGVRGLLIESTPEDETIAVLDELSKEIASTLGLGAINTFTALLFPKPEWTQATKDALLPFAQIATQVLQRLGGDYAEFADQVEQNTHQWLPPPDPGIPLPALEILEFTTGQLVEAEPQALFPPIEMQEVEVVTIVLEAEADPPGLQRFEFEVATIERNTDERNTQPRQTGFLQNLFRRGQQRGEQQSDWVIRKQRRQAYQWVRPLGEDLQLAVVAIPAGTFLMGSPEDELERDSSEGPQHEVRVEAFYMAPYPITQAQWRFVAGLPQINRALNPDPSRFKGENRPVEQVSWYDAIEFCDRLSVYTSTEYRLPTEAEWEYACRAGTTTPFHFGETITTDLANYRGTDDKDLNWSGSYGDGPKGEYREETTPIDHFGIANAFGLSDMHGNVWEWCQDHWHSSYEGAPTDGSAWLTDNEDSSRILRGGSWILNPRDCRSAYRYSNSPDYRDINLGFRVVCSAPRTL